MSATRAIKTMACGGCPYGFAGHTCTAPEWGESGRRFTENAVGRDLGVEAWCPLDSVNDAIANESAAAQVMHEISVMPGGDAITRNLGLGIYESVLHALDNASGVKR